MADKLNQDSIRSRGVYPRAGVDGLTSMNSLHDFRIVDGEPDIRGWDVMTMDSKKAGKVHDLLVDTFAMKVRYVDIALDKGIVGGKSERCVLMPIGAVQLNDDADNIRLDHVTVAQLLVLPEYKHEPLSREQERDLIGHFGTVGEASTAGTLAFGAVGMAEKHAANTVKDEDFYSQSHFNDSGLHRGTGVLMGEDEESRYLTRSEEELEIGTRSLQAGEVDVRRTIETEHVKRTVPISHEEVTIERRAVAADSRTDATISPDEIRMPLMAEEVVVEKRVVPKEEVIITKHLVADQKIVEADVRKERVDVDRHMNADKSTDSGTEKR